LSSWQDSSADISQQVQIGTGAQIDSLLGSSAPSSLAMPSSSAVNGATSGNGSNVSSATMNQSSYLSDNSGLSNAFAAVNLEDFGAGKSAHKPAETAPRQAQATAAFNSSYIANPFNPSMLNLANYHGYTPQTNTGTQNLYGGQGGSGGGGGGGTTGGSAGSNAYNQAYGSYSNYGGYDMSTAAAGYGGASVGDMSNMPYASAYQNTAFMNQYGGMVGMDAMSIYGNMGHQSTQTGTRAESEEVRGGPCGAAPAANAGQAAATCWPWQPPTCQGDEDSWTEAADPVQGQGGLDASDDSDSGPGKSSAAEEAIQPRPPEAFDMQGLKAIVKDDDDPFSLAETGKETAAVASKNPKQPTHLSPTSNTGAEGLDAEGMCANSDGRRCRQGSSLNCGKRGTWQRSAQARSMTISDGARMPCGGRSSPLSVGTCYTTRRGVRGLFCDGHYVRG
jgi:hypothetical protein